MAKNKFETQLTKPELKRLVEVEMLRLHLRSLQDRMWKLPDKSSEMHMVQQKVAEAIQWLELELQSQEPIDGMKS